MVPFHTTRYHGKSKVLDDGRIVVVDIISKQESPPNGAILVRVTSPVGKSKTIDEHPPVQINTTPDGEREVLSAYSLEVLEAIRELTEGLV